jgi:hypothetical protein
MLTNIYIQSIDDCAFDPWLWLVCRYLEYADHQWPTRYSSRVDGLLFPHTDCYSSNKGVFDDE